MLSQDTAAGDMLAADFGAALADGLDGWTIGVVTDPERLAAATWIPADPPDLQGLPRQGWKLHLSATIANAGDVLDRVIPVLREQPVMLKVAATGARLARLNAGLDGPTQVGKFMTLYPPDDASAVRLAAALHAATDGLSAPAIPSDRALHEGSLVHYRYGGFSTERVQNAMGQPLLAIEGPDGELIADQRRMRYRKPDWVDDPFEAAGLSTPLVNADHILDGRFLLLLPLAMAARGTVHMGVDLHEGARVVVKQANAGATVGVDGRDARDRLLVEADVLALLSTDSGAPRLIARGETASNAYVAMEEIPGETAGWHLADAAIRGDHLAAETVRRWVLDVARTVQRLHDLGWAYRDVKTANIIIEEGAEGAARLIDFEIARPLGEAGGQGNGGTRGYQPPLQAGPDGALLPVTAQDDVYGIGALLWGLLLGMEPSAAPHPLDLPRLAADALHPDHDPELLAIAMRCLDHDPSRRPPTLTPVIEALVAWSPADADPPGAAINRARRGGSDAVVTQLQTPGDLLALATAAGERLLADAVEVPEGLAWVSRRRDTSGVITRTLYEGTAGVAMALAQLHVEGLLDAEETILSACRWLIDGDDGLSHPPGLFSGEAGVAVGLAQIGSWLERPALLAAGAEIGRHLPPPDGIGPDYTLGDAGLVRASLLLLELTGDGQFLDHAIEAGERILATAIAGDEGVGWALPDDLPVIGGKVCPGYGHGGAGIADVLADLHDVTGEPRWRTTAGAALDLVEARATAHEDRLDWGEDADTDPIGGYWCNGAGGVGVALARAGRRDSAIRAARTVARTRAVGPTRCHGLAGNIEALDAIIGWTGETAFRPDLARLGSLLVGWHRGDGTWAGESPDTITPDAMVGYAGVIPALLLLAGRPPRDGTLLRRPSGDRLTGT